tara:strand:- start:75 stop:374 length:300 start_codon:yes stop_codon:yes gene_type:complete
MSLLWENLARQLDSVRAAQSTSTAVVDGTGGLSRQQRLEAALAAVQDKGNPLMIESLKAALEGREARMELPELPKGLEAELSGPEAFLSSIPKDLKPKQ